MHPLILTRVRCLLRSGVNGYVAGSMYAKMEGQSWVRGLVVSYLLFLGPFFLVSTFLNFVAVGYTSSAALPVGTVVVILLILTLVPPPLVLSGHAASLSQVSFPLNVIGGIAGRNFAGPMEAPCRTTKLPREIPPLPWSSSHRPSPPFPY